MSIRSKIFQIFSRRPKDTAPGNGLVLGYGGISLLDSRGKEINSTYNSCVDCLSKHIGKIVPKVMLWDDENERRSTLARVISLRPNPLQSAYEFYYSLAKDYYSNGLAIAHLEYRNGQLTAVLPVDTSSIKISEHSSTDVYLEVNTSDGKKFVDSCENFLILVRKSNSRKPILAVDESIDQVVKVLNTNNEGFARAIAESKIIRYVAKLASVTDESRKKKLKQAFTEQLKDGDGLLIADGVLDLKELSGKASVYAKQPELDDFIDEVYAYFGLTKNFVKGDYTEDQYQSAYQTSLEPFMIDLAQEMTYKLFTDTEISHGNRIAITMNRLDTASTTTRINMANAIVKCGMYRPNDIMALLYQEPMEGGDKVVQSLNYVDSEKANEYQEVGGDEDKTPADNTDEEDDDASNKEDNGKEPEDNGSQKNTD